MIRINLLPVEQTKKWELGQKQILLFILVIVAVAMGNWTWRSGVMETLQAKKTQVERLKRDIAALDKVIAEVKNIAKEKEAIEEKLTVLDNLRKGRTGPVKMLDALAVLMPERAWILSFEEKAGALVLKGGAVTNEDLADLMQALKGSPYFSEPTLKRSVQKGDRGGVTYIEFELQCSINYAV